MSYSTDESEYKYAYTLYLKGVDAEGEERKRFLRQAENVLENVSDNYPDKHNLLSRIRSML